MSTVVAMAKKWQIAQTLRDEILRGKFAASDRFPSERALVRRFSVARETVRAALRELAEEHMIRRRIGKGTSVVAEQAREPRFALLAPDVFYPFYMRIVRGIEASLAGRVHDGGGLLTAALGAGSSRGRAAKAYEFAKVCVRERVSGVFFQPLQFITEGERINRRILSLFVEARTPVVLLDSDIVAPPSRSEFDLVGVDNTRIGYELARHVIDAGARRVMYFSNPLPAPTSLKRGTGVGIAAVEAGLPWGRECVFFANPSDIVAARRVFSGSKRPDAIIAVNDFVASKLLETLVAIGQRVPDDVLLAGVNGDSIAEQCMPKLTTAVQPCADIGGAAVDLMFARLANPNAVPREIFLSASLIVRESTQPRHGVKFMKRARRGKCRKTRKAS